MDKLVQYLTNNFGRPFTIGAHSEIADLINSLNREERSELRYRLFNEARKIEQSNRGQQVVSWLQNCFELIEKYMFQMHRVFFSSGTEILESISELLKETSQTLDLCVFTITDERLVEDILTCHHRG